MHSINPSMLTMVQNPLGRKDFLDGDGRGGEALHPAVSR